MIRVDPSPILFYFLFFYSIRIDPSWSDPDWLIRSDFFTYLAKMFVCPVPKISRVMMKWCRRASHLGRFTLWNNGRRATQLGRFTLWHHGRLATQLSRFTLWHNRRWASGGWQWGLEPSLHDRPSDCPPQLRNLAEWDWVLIFVQNKYSGKCRHGRSMSFSSYFKFSRLQTSRKGFHELF